MGTVKQSPCRPRPLPCARNSRSFRVLGPVVLLVAVALQLAAYLRWPSLASQVDLLTYRFGAARVLGGRGLYSVGMDG
jgi:alpha-1,2-mannosyltransferase